MFVRGEYFQFICIPTIISRIGPRALLSVLVKNGEIPPDAQEDLVPLQGEGVEILKTDRSQMFCNGCPEVNLFSGGQFNSICQRFNERIPLLANANYFPGEENGWIEGTFSS